jgi:TPR repeat protein
MERVKANDPVALRAKGVACYSGGDYEGAFEYYSKAAGLGDIEAHYNLTYMYNDGKGVEKDVKKEVYHLEEASIGGHPSARYNLANHEGRNGRIERAMKHYIISAKLGDGQGLDAVKMCFRGGIVSKEDYEAALRGHQAAVDATKSEQREAAEKSGMKGLIYKSMT